MVLDPVGTAANVSGVTQDGALLHCKEVVAFGEAGYRSVAKREQALGLKWHVQCNPGKRRHLDLSSDWAQMLEKAEQLEAGVRAKLSTRST